MANNKIEYGIVPPSKYEEVVHFMRYGLADEPLNASSGLCVSGEPCPLLDNYNLSALKDGMSVMAVDKHTGKIVGALLNGVIKKGDVEKSIEASRSIDNIAYHRMFGLLYQVNKDLDLFSKYEIDKLFEAKILSVESNYRGKGIAMELCLRSEAVAMEHGFKVMKVDATSNFTQKILDKMGFTVEKSIRYEDIKDRNGKKIYRTKPPHESYKVMMKILPNNSN